jgi:hypothetical protein
MVDDSNRADEPGPTPETGSEEEIPLGQRLFDSPFILLAACTIIFLVFFTGWGLWEIFTLPEAPLP